MSKFVDEVKWNDQGLVAAIAQDWKTNEVLMLAWMNAEALALTEQKQQAVYWSRSRKKLWFKGEESGNSQWIKEIRIDCDADVVLLKIEQKGGIACHTGRRRCFFRVLADRQWQIDEEIIKNPEEIYQ